MLQLLLEDVAAKPGAQDVSPTVAPSIPSSAEVVHFEGPLMFSPKSAPPCPYVFSANVLEVGEISLQKSVF